MRAVWSFWSAPFREYMGRSWREPIDHWLAWGLSLRLARNHYPETMLVTDLAGKALLVNRLGLSFTHVSTELERLRNADVGWWAMGKLVAYSLQDQPFVHLDTDVFLWKPLPPSVADAPVFAQCPEEHHAVDEWCGVSDIENAFARHGLALPAEWDAQLPHESRYARQENCGILGGTRPDFLRHYSNLVLDFLTSPANAPAWASLPEKSGFNPVIEQFTLSACLEFHRIGIRHLFPTFWDAYNSDQAGRLGYTHLLGDAKRNPFVIDRLKQRTAREDKAFYRHCLRLSRNSS